MYITHGVKPGYHPVNPPSSLSLIMNGGIPPPPPPQRARRLFSRRLSRTSISKRLPVPPKSLTDFPDFRGTHAVGMRVRFETDTYPIVCSIRRTGSYKKPVLSKGWIEFVRKTNLKVGDEVTLSKLEQEGEEPIYLIEVERAVSVPINKQQAGPSLPQAAQETVAVAAGRRSLPPLRGDQLKRKRELKLCSAIHATKELEETKPLGPPAQYATRFGDSVDQFRVNSVHTSPDYGENMKDRDQKMMQLGVGGPSNSRPAVKRFSASISLVEKSVRRNMDLTLKLGR